MKTLQLHVMDLYSDTAQQALQSAQKEALRFNTSRIEPEHIFLGVVAHQDEEVVTVLCALGLEPQVLRRRLSEVLPAVERSKSQSLNFSFSYDAQRCLDAAFTISSRLSSSRITPLHLLLGSLRHSRLQPLLVLLASGDEGGLPTFITENEGAIYTSAIDQFIQSRIRVQSTFMPNPQASRQVLTGAMRPTTLFADIIGFDTVKHSLFEMVKFLRRYQEIQPSRWKSLTGVFMVGYPSSERLWLVRALAGEAVVPLFSLSFSTMVSLLHGLDSHLLNLERLDLSAPEAQLLETGSSSQRGRRLIQHMFAEVKKSGPGVLLLDDLDAIDSNATAIERENWTHQIVVEMDGLDTHPPIVVVATGRYPDGTGRMLMQMHRFSRQIQVNSGFMPQFVSNTKLCLSCKQEVLAHWKHCIYCGASVSRICCVCAALQIDIEGARFCPECGSEWQDG